MISIDDHPPPDPQNHHHQQQISHDLNINSHEKAPASVSDLDLFKSPPADLDDTNPPLPNFSIRDYVFSSRSKNIACNWPFSQESLQLCFKHGVKNLLPPFQPLDLARDNRLPDEELVTDGKPADDEFESIASDGAKSSQELALESVSTYSSDSKGDKESQSHLEEDLTHSKSKKTPPASSHKTENSTIKKNRLVVKLNSGVEPVEEVTPNNFVVSETMASKVCPVCKTFSSSSNTTLNAHIDQCLSGESSMKWTANPNPKVIVKHRIKPRKMRMMVDIYKTAPRCTVEELDRRNGTSWATNSSFPAQEFESQGEEEKEEPKTTTINPEGTDHEGAVYIDTNGTKVRILSVPKAGTSDDHGARKLLKGVKGSKIVMGKKKNKVHEQKHHQKYLKLSPNSKKFRSPKPHGGASEARSSREDDVAVEESCNKEDGGKQPMKAQAHMKMDDLAIVRPPWACSKRTRLAKKFSGKDGKLELRRHSSNDLLVENDKSSSGCGLRTPPGSSDNMSSSQSSKKTETSSPYRGQPLTSNGSPVEGADIRSKGGKFSSLRNNLQSASREPIPASNLNLKRKFSALEKSRGNCLSNEKAVVGPSQDSLEQQSGMEEDTDVRISSERSNLLKAEKEKQEMKISGEEKSITSKSSNGESSVGLETALVDPESVRNETLSSHVEQNGIVPAPKVIDAEGSYMDLSNSFDPEFSMLVSQPDDKFEARECLRSPKRTLHEERMFCVDDTGKNIFGNDIEDGAEDFEKNGNYYQEVDPIPIPGPPGSFLPSPGGDMVSDELQGNSSLTTTSKGENQHHHDTMDRDSMSTSPVSTVSNPSLARSDSRSSDKFSVRSTFLQDDIRLGLSGAMVDAIDERSTTPVKAGDWRSVNTSFAEKGQPPTALKNDQPCCCSRKEGASNYQESSLLRKRALESNRSPNSLNFGSEMFSLSNYPASSAPGTVVFPRTMNSPAAAAGSTSKFSVHSDCDSAASPKPVLRLMGKNLTVVNTDEDVSSSQQFRPPPPMNSQQHPSQQFLTVQKEDHNSNFSHGYPSQRPIIFTQNQNGSKSQHFNVHPTINFKSHVDLKPVHALDRMISSTRGELTASLDCYGHGNPYPGPTIPQARACQGHNRLDTQAGRVYNATSKPIKEIIIIDDSPDNEADDAMLNERMSRNRVSSSSSIPTDMPPGYNNSSPHLNPLYTMYQPQSYSTGGGGGSLVFRSGSFQTGSSGMLHPSSLGSPSPSTSHLRSSAVYYPPSFP